MAQTVKGEDLRPVELGDQDLSTTEVKLDPQSTQEPMEKGQLQNAESVSSNQNFLLRKFFVARPGAFDQATEDLKNQVVTKEKETVNSAWLLVESLSENNTDLPIHLFWNNRSHTERTSKELSIIMHDMVKVDHWNNEKERVVLLTEKSLFICKYDFIMLCCQQIQKVPLNFIDRICTGPFSFPPKSLDKREGEGLRIYWDKLREPSFLSRWNPLSGDLPYTTFTEHPLKNCSEQFSNICLLSSFNNHLVDAVQAAHKADPVPGRANGALILNQPLLIETYVGVLSFIGNRNKLGYSLARGSVGF